MTFQTIQLVFLQIPWNKAAHGKLGLSVSINNHTIPQAIKSFVKLIVKSNKDREQRRNLALEHAANCLPISILPTKKSLSPNNFTPT